MNRLLLFLMIFLASFMKDDTVMADGNADKILIEERNVNGIYAHITTNDSIHHMVNHPAFRGFGRYLLPRDNGTNDYDMSLNHVGSLHEGFPLAMVLSQKGYNAFVLRYRTGSGLRATEDLAAAISYVFKNAARLEVGVADYALWGGSAGARMVGNIALHGTAGFGGDDLPKPGIVVIAYTGHSIFSENYPPTFITVSEDDRIVDVSVVERRVEKLRNAGVEVEYRKYKNAGHGFGLGVGTDAEGWIQHAIGFWESHLSK